MAGGEALQDHKGLHIDLRLPKPLAVQLENARFDPGGSAAALAAALAALAAFGRAALGPLAARRVRLRSGRSSRLALAALAHFGDRGHDVRRLISDLAALDGHLVEEVQRVPQRDAAQRRLGLLGELDTVLRGTVGALVPRRGQAVRGRQGHPRRRRADGAAGPRLLPRLLPRWRKTANLGARGDDVVVRVADATLPNTPGVHIVQQVVGLSQRH
mmetsp:Transcript_37371/g.112990  ORF Transcript_37371/g.112990 Transcript_37371/m.112990 type:complete len:215 (+) Transcript_37371:484-1128(+)